MNITNYSLVLDDSNEIITLQYLGNEHVIITNRNKTEKTQASVPRIILKKFMEMIDET